MTSWQTRPSSDREDPLRPSLIERAKKRQVNEGKTEGHYVVVGNSSLGDQYPNYLVFQNKDGKWVCDCLNLNRTGGAYRKTCSHITGVLLHIQRNGEWGGPKVVEVSEPRKTPSALLKLAEIPEIEPAIEPAEPLDGFPESSKAKVIPLPLDEDSLWAKINEDPDWIPHPQQVTTNASDPQLPEKFQEYREPQWGAIREIEEALADGYKAVFVSAPTGSGKTLIAESIRRLLGVRGIYTCTTKTLQDQILSEFSYARVIKGRGNYPTLDDPQRTTLDCTKAKASLPACKNCPGWSSERAGASWNSHDPEDPTEEGAVWHCLFCHPSYKCPYETAKMQAAGARLAVLNTAYYLAETNYVNNSLFRNRGLVLIDEADMLEEELMRFIELQITARDRQMLGVGLPEKKTVDESWVEWLVEEVLPATKKALGNIDLAPNLFGEVNVDELKRKKKIQQLRGKIATLLEEIEDEETGETKVVLNKDWIYTGYEKDRDGKYPPDHKVNVTFKPVHVQGLSKGTLWNKAQQFVLLSATFVSPAMTAEFLGLEESEWTTVEVESSFPVLQRPIIPRMVADVVAKNMNEATPLLIEEITGLLEEHPDERVLIHSVSYALTKDLYFELKHLGFGDRLVTYFNSLDRQNALDQYLAIDNGVLIAPSFDRGVDLPADDCRVIIVAKIPYLSMGDKQVTARLYGTGRAGKMWYAMQAIRSLCQMTGRGMRSADDYCRTYILDKQFNRLYSQNRRLFPKWWSDAIVWDENDPKWKGMV